MLSVAITCLDVGEIVGVLVVFFLKLGLRERAQRRLGLVNVALVLAVLVFDHRVVDDFDRRVHAAILQSLPEVDEDR